MKRIFTFLFLFSTITLGFSQITDLSAPQSHFLSNNPSFTNLTKTALDTCGPYFNNYVGLAKTTDVYFEELRTGDASDFNPYAGRAQRFHANQPIEVSGLQFYSFQNNETLDSLPVVTVLYDYDEALDSTGVELARDTVYVLHTEFTPLLPDIEVNSHFDDPVIVTEDYVVALYTFTNDSLKIITNDPGGDGDGEGVSFAYYENPAAPSFTGWYATLPVFGPAYDIDYLINPLVEFQLHDGFSLTGDEVCPNIVSATCVEYVQVANFSDPHYNRDYSDPLQNIRWDWGDGFQNDDLATLCHTFEESGTFTTTLIDTLARYVFADSSCAVELTQSVLVLDSTIAAGSFTSTGLSADFLGTPTNEDSVFWDFGDGSPGSTEMDPSHTYDAPGTYDVWFYAYGPCNTDSVQFIVDASDASISENESGILIYPNPANTFVVINGITPGTTIRIVNLLGQEVAQEVAINTTSELNTSVFAPGAYFVNLILDGQTTTKKLIVKH